MFIRLRELLWFYSEWLLLRIVKATRLAAMRSNPNYSKAHKNRLWQLCKQIKKLLTFRSLSVIIMMSVLTGCGTMRSSSLSTQSCVDMTTYVNSGKVAAQVISKERICEQERLSSMGVNIGEEDDWKSL